MTPHNWVRIPESEYVNYGIVFFSVHNEYICRCTRCNSLLINTNINNIKESRIPEDCDIAMIQGIHEL